MGEQKKAFIVGLLTALICSVLVSGSVALLRPRQDRSRAEDRISNIVLAAGFEKSDVHTMFEDFKPVLITMVDGSYTAADNPEAWNDNFSLMLRDSQAVTPISKSDDIASLGVLPKQMLAYILYTDEKPSIAVFHIYGSGLWSVMQGYLAVHIDTQTVAGIKFFEHGETPGLGGEIDNPLWQAKWQGKEIYDDDGKVVFTFSRTPVQPDSSEAAYSVDGLSGATLTTDGLKNVINFWMGPQGYQPFLNKIRGEL